MKPTDELVLRAIETTRKMVKEYDCVVPVFFIGGEELKIVHFPFEKDSDKQMATMLVKKLADEMNADFILFIAESYALKCDLEEWQKTGHLYKSISEHPKAVEIMAFMLDTKTKSWLGSAEIGKGRVLGEIEWQEGGGEGRFANLLGKKPTLH